VGQIAGSESVDGSRFVVGPADRGGGTEVELELTSLGARVGFVVELVEHSLAVDVAGDDAVASFAGAGRVHAGAVLEHGQRLLPIRTRQ